MIKSTSHKKNLSDLFLQMGSLHTTNFYKSWQTQQAVAKVILVLSMDLRDFEVLGQYLRTKENGEGICQCRTRKNNSGWR